MVTRVSRFDADWWVVQKRLIYILVIIASLAVVAGGCGLYVWLYGNPFKSAAVSDPALADASFHVRDDKSEAIRVATGAVETTTSGGDQTTLRGGEYVAVNQQGAVAQREHLLEAPSPLTPRNLERIAARKGAATAVALKWQKPSTGAPAH